MWVTYVIHSATQVIKYFKTVDYLWCLKSNAFDTFEGHLAKTGLLDHYLLYLHFKLFTWKSNFVCQFIEVYLKQYAVRASYSY